MRLWNKAPHATGAAFHTLALRPFAPRRCGYKRKRALRSWAYCREQAQGRFNSREQKVPPWSALWELRKGMRNVIIYDNLYLRRSMFAVDYYEEERGRRPVEEFIDSLDVRMRATVFGRLALLEEHGQRLGMPFSRHLEDGIYELRTPQGSNITRVLYFFVVGERAILTHSFVKKAQKTPVREIERAKRARDDWKARNE